MLSSLGCISTSGMVGKLSVPNIVSISNKVFQLINKTNTTVPSTDSTGTYALTNSGPVTMITDSYVGNVFSFNATNYIKTATSPVRSVVSLCWWVYYTGQNGVTLLNSLWWPIYYTGNKLGSTIYWTGGGPEIQETTAQTTNTWVHYAIVIDATTVYLYVNGALNTSVALGGAAGSGAWGRTDQSGIYGSNPFSIGVYDQVNSISITGATANFSGYLDDVRIYNKALTATEVQTVLTEQVRLNTYSTLSVSATCNIKYTGNLVIGVNTATFPNTTNYYYVFVQSGTGVIYIDKTVTASVLAVGAGGGGGGNSLNNLTAGAGGGGGAYYYTSSISITTGQLIFASIGTGGTGGTGNTGNGTNGSAGTSTKLYGGNFPSMTLNGGGGGNGATNTNASVYGTGGTHTNGTGNGQNGGNGGTGGQGHVGVSITLGDMAATNYSSGAHGGNQYGGSSNGSVAGEAPTIGGGGAGGNGTAAGTRNGTTGGNGGIVIVLPITV